MVNNRILTTEISYDCPNEGGSPMTSDRRQFLVTLTTALAAPTAALAQSPAMSRITAYVCLVRRP